MSGTSHKSPTPKTEIHPKTQQTFREPVNQQNEQKNMYQGKGPSDSLQLNEWSGFQDSRFLKDDDQLGVINNQEISAIYPNVLRSCIFI